VRVRKGVKVDFNSKIPFVNRVMNDYYSSLSQPEYFENKLYLTICYKPFNAEDKVSQFISKKKRTKISLMNPLMI
jgi:type IV secretion system protein VirB4